MCRTKITGFSSPVSVGLIFFLLSLFSLSSVSFFFSVSKNPVLFTSSLSWEGQGGDFLREKEKTKEKGRERERKEERRILHTQVWYRNICPLTDWPYRPSEWRKEGETFFLSLSLCFFLSLCICLNEKEIRRKRVREERKLRQKKVEEKELESSNSDPGSRRSEWETFLSLSSSFHTLSPRFISRATLVVVLYLSTFIVFTSSCVRREGEKESNRKKRERE